MPLAETAQETLLKTERDLNVRIDLLHDRFGLGETAGSYSLAAMADSTEFDAMRPVSIAVGRHMQHSYMRWKRLFDITAAAIGAMCLAPLMVVVVPIVLLDVGYPFIFWQQRPGVRGKPIRVLKFRTMRTARNAEGRIDLVILVPEIRDRQRLTLRVGVDDQPYADRTAISFHCHKPPPPVNPEHKRGLAHIN